MQYHYILTLGAIWRAMVTIRPYVNKIIWDKADVVLKQVDSLNFAQENGSCKSSVIVSYNKTDMALWFVQYDFLWQFGKCHCTSRRLWHTLCITTMPYFVHHNYDILCASQLWHTLCITTMTYFAHHNYDILCASQLWYILCFITQWQQRMTECHHMQIQLGPCDAKLQRDSSICIDNGKKHSLQDSRA